MIAVIGFVMFAQHSSAQPSTGQWDRALGICIIVLVSIIASMASRRLTKVPR